MKEMDSTKMEFLLTLNDNIVVQRFFNVRGFNPKAKNSVDLYDYIKSLKEELQYYLKMKTVVYMMDNRDAITHDPSIMNTSYTEGPEVFNLFICMFFDPILKKYSNMERKTSTKKAIIYI